MSIMTTPPTHEQIRDVLSTVRDPELHRSLTELNMVERIDVAPDGRVSVTVLLTIAGCPMRETIEREVEAAAARVPGVTAVEVTLIPMSDDQRRILLETLRGSATKDIPFARPESRTSVIAVASGKGGVGKSTVTVNLAAALAMEGMSVGVLDADVYGFSVPRMLGVTDRPTRVADLIIPPVAGGVKVISIGMFVDGNTAVVWRGPMLHRALQQFLSDVYWGDLDFLLLDLPPGTGDVALSTAQLIPSAELLVVTTPQAAAAEVAERAGSIATQTRQRVIGIVENMAGLPMPDGSVLDLFGSGGGDQVAESLSRVTGTKVPVLGRVPLDPDITAGGDAGRPVVLGDPASVAARTLRSVARTLAAKRVKPLLKVPLSLSVVRR